MSLPVVLLPEALVDLDEAVAWYEGQRAGLGAVHHSKRDPSVWQARV